MKAAGPLLKTRSRRVVARAPARVKCEAHLNWIRHLPCVITGAEEGVIAHHCMHGEPSATGARSGDNWAVPMLEALHGAQFPAGLHRGGNEPRWWEARAVDPLAIARRLWAVSIVSGRCKAKASDLPAAYALAGDWKAWIANGYRDAL